MQPLCVNMMTAAPHASLLHHPVEVARWPDSGIILLSPPFSCPVPTLQVPGMPAGLRNLGNTCYVNAAMQFLHSIPAFRHALYVLEPQLAQQDIVKQLR